MKQVICPKCGKTFSFDESRYDASCNISFICPACRKRFLMTLPEIDACHKNDIDTSLGFITVLEMRSDTGKNFLYTQAII